jgi:pyruvate dehydrogenase complex dehydrogenase (E1) component
MTDDIAALRELEKRVLCLASWTIHNANHLRDNDDGLKVGGHQASSASLATIMTALYFAVLRPQPRVRLARKTFEQRSREPRFSDPGLAGEQHHLVFAGLCLRPAPKQ